MKNILFFLLSAFVLASCQKSIDTVSQDQAFLNVSYGSDTAQRMDVYLPASRSADTTKAIVFIHGGAWNSGDKSELTQYVTSLKKRLPNYAVFNINYRLASTTGNLFPTQENDVQ